MNLQEHHMEYGFNLFFSHVLSVIILIRKTEGG